MIIEDTIGGPQRERSQRIEGGDEQLGRGRRCLLIRFASLGR